MATRLSKLVVAVEGALSPVVMLGEGIDRGLNSLLPRPPQDEEDREAMAEQFKQVVAAEAEVPPDEQVLLNGVFRLGQTEVHEIMVPRIDLRRDRQRLDLARSRQHRAVVGAFAAAGVRATIDNVVGVLYAKDLLPSVLAGREPADGWTSLVRSPVFIPRSKPADRQLRDFQATRTHFAVVVDEYGGTAGIITIEDVLEEIVGDIRDEHDVEEPSVEHVDDRRVRVSARRHADGVVGIAPSRFRARGYFHRRWAGVRPVRTRTEAGRVGELRRLSGDGRSRRAASRATGDVRADRLEIGARGMTSTTLLLLTVGIVAWLTAAATAVRSVSRIWLRHWVEQQLSGSGAAALYLERPHGLLLTASTGVALTVFTSGVILANAAGGSIVDAPGRGRGVCAGLAGRGTAGAPRHRAALAERRSSRSCCRHCRCWR